MYNAIESQLHLSTTNYNGTPINIHEPQLPLTYQYLVSKNHMYLRIICKNATGGRNDNRLTS